MNNNHSSRRHFLKGMAAAGVALPALSSLSHNVYAASPSSSNHTLVVVNLLGGMDSLSALVPYHEAVYFDKRPNIAIPARGRIDLNGQFALHKALSPLHEIYQLGDLAFVVAAGLGERSVTRSHFDGQIRLQSGSDDHARTDGWLGRYLNVPSANNAIFRGVSMGNLSRIFNGYDNVPGIRNLAEFRLNATPGSNDAITKMYAGSTDHPMLAVQARQATAALEFAAARALGSTPKPAAYGDSLIGNKLHQVAELIHADIGLEVAHVTMEHWDTHDDMGTWDAGNVHNLFSMLGTSLAAFHQEAMRSNRNVTLVVMSEFGRRVEQNHSGGTEHGTGGALMVMGQGINGGTIYGTWPGLRRLEYGDLKTTTDYRQVLSEIIANRVGKAHLLPQIFPDYTAPSYLGIS